MRPFLVKDTYYHYCEIGQGTVDDLGRGCRYFNATIKGNGSDGPFDCRTHRVPVY
jgi:hypothetical protein